MPDMKSKYSLILTVCTFLSALHLTGCYKPVEEPVIIRTLPLPTPKPSTLRSIAGSSLERRPLSYTVLGEGSDVIFILAAIHGNEKAGISLVHRMETYLQQHQEMLEKRKVILLPNANPDGAARNSRYNARGIAGRR